MKFKVYKGTGSQTQAKSNKKRLKILSSQSVPYHPNQRRRTSTALLDTMIPLLGVIVLILTAVIVINQIERLVLDQYTIPVYHVVD